VNQSVYRLIHVARSLETFWFPKITLIWKLVVDYNRLLQVQMQYFQNGGTSENTVNRCHLCFFKQKGPILTSHFDSTLTFEFSTSFCQYLSVIVFELCHLFCKKVRLQGFIKKFIIREPSEINNLFLFYWLAKYLAAFLCYQRHFFNVSYAYCNFLKLIIKKWRKLHFFK
jgi:hypothetical protein